MHLGRRQLALWNHRMPYPLTWHWRKWLPERKGQRCRMLARGTMNSCLIEFEDSHRVVTSRYAVRKVGGAT